MSLAFIFPTLSWAFEVKSESEQGTARTETSAGVDPALARQFSVPARYGRIVEATPSQGGPTLLLVQDLHCNVEVQNNIRGILLNWQRRHPQLGLVAVEGASGIIPTLELLSLPETPAKRAVLNYFLREGKLTGADVLSVTARPAWELFGAEDPALYDQSLDLIAKFATDENRGLVFELMDQVRFLRSRTYNPDLLAFEQRRDAVLRGRLGSDEYHRALLQEARWRRLPLSPPPTPQSGSTDFQDQVAQDQYLESVIREALFRTSQERALFGSQRFVELSEQLLTVSLSQAEVEEFRARRRTTSLSGIQKDVQAELRKLEYAAGLDTRFGSDIAALEPMLDQGLEFYRLAELRNTALFERTVARARERNDRVVALVSGGFHAQAIGALARRQGLGCVCVRPAQNGPDTANNYFQLLRNPDQPTELEKLVALGPRRGTAIAVRNFVATNSARLREAVGTVEEAWGVLRGRTSALASRAVRVARNTVRFRMPEGGRPYFLTFGPQSELVITDRSPQPALARPGVRISGLVLFGLGMGISIVTTLMGITLTPALVVVVLGIVLIGAWAFQNPDFDFSQMTTKRVLVLSSVVIGSMLLAVFALPMLGDLLNTLIGSPQPAVTHLQAATTSVHTSLSMLPTGSLTVHQNTGGLGPAAFGVASQGVTAVLGSVLAAPGQLLAPFVRRKPKTKLSDRRALLERQRTEQSIREQLGQEIEPESIDLEVHVPGMSGEVVQSSFDEWATNGLSSFASGIETPLYLMTLNLDDPLLIVGAPATALVDPVDLERTQAVMSMNVQFYQFVRDGQVVTGLRALPDWVVRAMARNLDPQALATGKKTNPVIKANLPKLPKDMVAILAPLLTQLAAEFKGKESLFALSPAEFQELLENVAAHEGAHGPMTHLPPEETDPEITDQATRALFASLATFRFWDLYWNDPALRNNVLFYKNVVKGLDSIKDEPVDTEEQRARTRDIFEAVVTVEMLCDRFGTMYIRENAAKLAVYRQTLTTVSKRSGRFFREGQFTIDELLFLEEERAAGRLKTALEKQFPGILPAEISGIEAELDRIERDNIYVRKFGVPPLTRAERQMFAELLDFLKAMDRQGGGEILYYPSAYHRANSWAYYVTLISKHLSISRYGAVDWAQAVMGDGSLPPLAEAVATAAVAVKEAVLPSDRPSPRLMDPPTMVPEAEAGADTDFNSVLDQSAPAVPGREEHVRPAAPKPEPLPLFGAGVTDQGMISDEGEAAADFMDALNGVPDRTGEDQDEARSRPGRGTAVAPRAPGIGVVKMGADSQDTAGTDDADFTSAEGQAVDVTAGRTQVRADEELAAEEAKKKDNLGLGWSVVGSRTMTRTENSTQTTPRSDQTNAPAAAMPVFLTSATRGSRSEAVAPVLSQMFGVWQELMNRAPAPPPDPLTLPFIIYSNDPTWQGLDPAVAAAFLAQYQGDPELQPLSEAFLKALRYESVSNSGPNSYEAIQAAGNNGAVLLSRPAEAYVPNSERLAGANPDHYAELAVDLVNRLLDQFAGTPGQAIPAITLQIADPILQSTLETYLEGLKATDRQAAALAQALTIVQMGTQTGVTGPQVSMFTSQNPVPVVITGGESGALTARELVNRLLDQFAGTPGQAIPAITLQIADPILQSTLETYLEGLKATDRQAAALAQALTIVAIGTQARGPQVAVFTPQNPVPIEISRTENGALSILVGQPFIAVPRSVEVSAEAARQSADNLRMVSNAGDFAGFYLLTKTQVDAVQLKNFGAAWAVTGMVNIENARLAADQQSAIRALAQRLLQVRPDLSATPGQKATLWYDAVQAAQKQALLAQGRAFDLEITYGAESADVSAKVLSLLAGALADETPFEGRVTGASILTLGTLAETSTQADLMNETALAAAERAASAAWRASLATNTDLREALWSLTGSEEPTPATLAVLRDALRDGVAGQAAVVVVSRAAGHTEPTHALRPEVDKVMRAYVGPSRTKGPDSVDPYGVGEVLAEEYPGLEVQVRGEFKTFSRVALALAGLRLVGRTLSGYTGSLLRGLRNPRDLIPNFRFVLPTFLKALRIMLDIVLGRFGVQQVTDPYLRQQIRLLLELEKAHGTDLKLAQTGQVPDTLAPVMPELLRLRQFLNNPLFGAIFRALGVNVNDLNVYLLLLIDRYQTMDQLRWYLTPGSYLRSVVRDPRTDLSPGVRRTLEGSTRFQRTLTRLDQRSSLRQVRSAIWQLIALLNTQGLNKTERKALQLSVLRLLSRIDPARQLGIQVRLDDGTVVQTQLPSVLLNTPQLLRGFYQHFDLYYQNGKRVPEPAQNMVVSTLQAA